MPPRKTPAKRKKPPPATTPTPVDDRKSPKQEVETVAELPNVSKVETEEISGQVEVSDPMLAKIEGDSTTAVAFSPKLVIEADVVVDHSAVDDVNEARNEDVCVEDEEPEEEEEPEEDEQPSGIDGSQLETVAAVKGDNEEEKQEHAEIIAAEEPNADKAPCNNDDTTKTSSEDYIALLIEHDNEESDDGSEGDDADNEDPSDNPVSDHNKEKDIEIYVGGLDKNTVEDDLVNVFQQFGELKSTRIVRNSTTKKSKGFAFIRFVSPDHAKHALSELKDGVEVRGKILKISQSQDNHTLYLGNISKTWKQEEVSQQLKQYGIEHIDMIRLPENPKIEGKNKGFAFLEFNSHSDAVTAYQRLKKPDAVFGRDISAKVAFAQTPVLQNDEDLLQATRVYLEGLTKDWNEEKVKEVCKKYGEIVKVDICQNTRNKNKDFGFVTFASNESALACVEGINNADFGEVKIKAEIAKSHPKKKSQKQIFSGGFKVEPSTTSNKKGGNVIKETSEPKSTKMKAQIKSNKKDITKNKSKVAIKNGETSKKTEILKIKGDSNPQQSNKKRKTPSKQNLNPPPRHSDTKKPKFGSEGQNSNSASKPGTHKRKGREEEEGGSKNRNRNSNRNTHDKKPFKKQKGSNMHGRERDNNNYRSNPNSNIDINGVRRGQLYDDYRVTSNNRYMDSLSYPPTSYLASDSYRLPPDSLSTRRFKEMEPHAGYIGPTSTTHTRSYVPTVVRTHNPHQTVYLSPGQSQLHSRYSDRSILTQSHRGGYSETSILPEVQSYRTYRGDPYDSGISRSGGHDGRGGGVVTYVGGPSIPSSQVRSHTSYYQGGGSYSGDYTSQRTYY